MDTEQRLKEIRLHARAQQDEKNKQLEEKAAQDAEAARVEADLSAKWKNVALPAIESARARLSHDLGDSGFVFTLAPAREWESRMLDILIPWREAHGAVQFERVGDQFYADWLTAASPQPILRTAIGEVTAKSIVDRITECIHNLSAPQKPSA